MESGDSFRRVAQAINIPYSTIWRAIRSMADVDLLWLEEVPGNPVRKQFRVILSPKGAKLKADLLALFKP